MNFIFVLLIICSPLISSENAMEEFESSNKKFTTSLYKELESNKSDNFVFSPFSAQTILSLTQSGAKDETAEEIKKALYLPSQEKLEEAITTLQPSLKTDAVQSANKIYVKNGFTINEDFKKVAAKFDAGLENIDFEKSAEAAKIMNDWVEDKTDHKIKDLVPKEILSNKTRSVLINALHLEVKWTSPFEAWTTSDNDFFKYGKDKIQVPTMHQTEVFNYYESKDLDAKLLELSLHNDVTFTIILPNQKEGVSQLSKNAQIFDRPQYRSVPVFISLPKFKVESRFDLGDTLKNLGIKKAFKAGEADFSGIAGEKGELVISKVIQKAFIDVNEEGLEAAAATFVEAVIELSAVEFTEEAKEFKVDHPFIFYIKLKNLILFAGKVEEP